MDAAGGPEPEMHQRRAPQQDVARRVLLLAAEGAEPTSARDVAAPVAPRDRVPTDAVQVLRRPRPVTGTQLMDVDGQLTVQADHGRWRGGTHLVAVPALRSLAGGPGTCPPGSCSVNGSGVHRNLLLRETGRRFSEGVGLLVTTEAAVGRHPL